MWIIVFILVLSYVSFRVMKWSTIANRPHSSFRPATLLEILLLHCMFFLVIFEKFFRALLYYELDLFAIWISLHKIFQMQPI